MGAAQGVRRLETEPRHVPEVGSGNGGGFGGKVGDHRFPTREAVLWGFATDAGEGRAIDGARRRVKVPGQKPPCGGADRRGAWPRRIKPPRVFGILSPE